MSFNRPTHCRTVCIWWRNTLAGLIISASLAYCSGHGTAELLDSTFLSSRYQTPQLLAPADEEHVPRELRLSFSGQAVEVSFLEIATDAAFRQRIFHRPLAAGTTFYVFEAPESRTYYWRLNGPRPTPVRSFRAGDGIYVSSAAGSGGQGTRISPYQSLQVALTKAQESKLPVFVAAGVYNETITFPPGVSAYGGYHPLSWQRDITAQKSVLVAQNPNGHSASAIYAPTLVDGFVFRSHFSSGDVNLLRTVGSSALLVIRNSIFDNGGQDTEQNLTAIRCDYNCQARVDANTFYSSYNSTQYAAVLSKNNSTPAITNNIFILRPVDPDLWNQRQVGVRLINSPGTIVSNNLFVSLANGDVRAGVMIDDFQGAVITNNVVYGIRGVDDFSLVNTDNNNNLFPASIENNLYYFYQGLSTCNSLFTYRPPSSMGACRIYHEATHTLAVLHAYVNWAAGSDKARANYIMPIGNAGQFVRRLPQQVLFTRADGGDNQTLTLYILDDNATSCDSLISTGTYLEWNEDGIARQVTGCSIHEEDSFEYHYRYTVSPPLGSVVENTRSRPVFLWDSYNGSYAWDFTFEKKSLSDDDWNTLRYGGKNTSGNNCGAPAGGPGPGPGAQSCGNVTSDRLGNVRSVGNGGLSQNTGGIDAVREGFSIGPWEID